MNEVVRKIVSVADLPERFREGFDPSRPVAIVQAAPDQDHSTPSGRDERTARGVERDHALVPAVRR